MKTQPKTIDTHRHKLTKANFTPDLSEFLYLLESPDLQALAGQWGITADFPATDKLAAIQTILQHLDKNPDQKIRSGRTKGVRPQQFIVKDRLYDLDLPGDIQLTLPDEYIDLVFEEDVTLKADTTYVTSCYSIRFKGKLKLEPGAKLFGAHRRGLYLDIKELNCPRLSVQPIWKRTINRDTPVISTAIDVGQDLGVTDHWLNNPNYFEQVPFEDGFLYQMQNNEAVRRWLNIHGHSGKEGSDPVPRIRRGRDGRDATWARAATNGQPAGNGQPGKPGQPGGDGHSPQLLSVQIKERLYGHVLFDARGGNGGRGGHGGRGQGARSGDGGDVRVRDQPALAMQGLSTAPGRGGGPPCRGGPGGQGGDGGNGGRGGNIKLIIDDQADINEGQFLVHTRGGLEGLGGDPGRGGMSHVGCDGNVWSSFGIHESGQCPLGGQNSAPPLSSEVGPKGLHGSITVNGRLISEADGNNRNDDPAAYSYPPLPENADLSDTLLDPDFRGFLLWEARNENI